MFKSKPQIIQFYIIRHENAKILDNEKKEKMICKIDSCREDKMGSIDGRLIYLEALIVILKRSNPSVESNDVICGFVDHGTEFRGYSLPTTGYPLFN